MGNFLNHRRTKILLYIFGGIILIVLLWYFFGDMLVFSYLKDSAEWGDYCHEDCVFTRDIAEKSLVFLASHRPWVENKVLKGVLNQNQPEEYRTILLDVYIMIIGEDNPLPEKIISLLEEEKTPPELKQRIIIVAGEIKQSLCDSGLVEYWEKIIFDNDEDRGIRGRAVGELIKCKEMEAMPLLIQAINFDRKGSVGLRASESLVEVLKEKKLSADLIEELKQLVYDKNIHPEIRYTLLNIFSFSYDKELGKNLLLSMYEDKNINIFIKDGVARNLNFLANQEIYSRLKYTEKESYSYDDNDIFYDSEAPYLSEEDWLSKVFPDRL